MILNETEVTEQLKDRRKGISVGTPYICTRVPFSVSSYGRSFDTDENTFRDTENSTNWIWLLQGKRN